MIERIINFIEALKSFQYNGKDIIILGPTASGKSNLSILISNFVGNIPIVNCDTRQFWRNLRLVTCSPTEQQKSSIPHFLFNYLENDEKPSLGHWSQELQKIGKKIIVGGSMFYPYCLLQGIPQVNISEKTKSICAKIKDASKYLKCMNIEVDYNDKYRVYRMLEFFIETGTTFNKFPTKFSRKCIVIAILTREEDLKRNIMDRIVENLDDWVEECFRNQNSNFRSVIGYQECLDYRQGILSKSETINAIFQRTSKYAKKQMKFMRRFSADHEIYMNEISNLFI